MNPIKVHNSGRGVIRDINPMRKTETIRSQGNLAKAKGEKLESIYMERRTINYTAWVAYEKALFDWKDCATESRAKTIEDARDAYRNTSQWLENIVKLIDLCWNDYVVRPLQDRFGSMMTEIEKHPKRVAIEQGGGEPKVSRLVHVTPANPKNLGESLAKMSMKRKAGGAEGPAKKTAKLTDKEMELREQGILKKLRFDRVECESPSEAKKRKTKEDKTVAEMQSIQPNMSAHLREAWSKENDHK